MNTDYDAPRAGTARVEMLSLEDLNTRRDQAQSASVDVDDSADLFELPGADLLDEDLTVAVVPMRIDEFRCAGCFLIHHRSQLARAGAAGMMCRECA